jgi:hypothetical protein
VRPADVTTTACGRCLTLGECCQNETRLTFITLWMYKFLEQPVARASQSLTGVKGAYMWGRVRSVVGIVLIAGAAAGCANSDELKARFNGRWGPPPAMQATDVANVAQNQLLVLSYLAAFDSGRGIRAFDRAQRCDFSELSVFAGTRAGCQEG